MQRASSSLPIKKPNSLTILVATLINLFLLGIPFLFIPQQGKIWQQPVVVTFLLLISVWCVIESAHPTAIFQPTDKNSRLQYLIGSALLMVFWISLTENLICCKTAFGLKAFFGILMIALGIGFRTIAIRTLGPFFLNDIALLPIHPLITHGIYSRTRHPSEAGTLSIAFGSALLLRSWIGMLLCIILLTPLILRRIKKEDQLLKSRHPIAFEQYTKKANSLIPALENRGNNREIASKKL